MIRTHLASGQRSLNTFHEKFAAQLNDTHPAVGVAELMRLLVDEHGMAGTKPGKSPTRPLPFTNHTLLPEALEKWPIDLFGRLLPRHLEIIFEINQRFLDEVRMRFPWDGQLENLSLIDER
jgi:starch phosphorylase